MHFLDDIFDEELGIAPNKRRAKKAHRPAVKRVTAKPVSKKASAKKTTRSSAKKPTRKTSVRKPLAIKKVKQKSFKIKQKKKSSIFLEPTKRLSQSISQAKTPFDIKQIVAPSPELVTDEELEEQKKTEEQSEEQPEETAEEKEQSEEQPEETEEQPEESEEPSNEQAQEESGDDSGDTSLEDLLLPSQEMRVSASETAKLKARILSLAKRADKLASSAIKQTKKKADSGDKHSKFKLQIFSKLKNLSAAMPVDSQARIKANRKIIMLCKPCVMR